MDNFTDAFGEPLVIGAEYAYVAGSNGFSDSFRGTLSKVSEKGNASIEVRERFRALYNKPMRNVDIDKKVVNCKTNRLVRC